MSYLQIAKRVEAGFYGDEKRADTASGKPSKPIESIEAFPAVLGLAVLLSSEKFGDVWLIPNEGARGQVGLEAVTLLPEELEILQAMEPDQIKRVFLVKREFPGAKVTRHGEIH